jgi:hypothetical protein
MNTDVWDREWRMGKGRSLSDFRVGLRKLYRSAAKTESHLNKLRAFQLDIKNLYLLAKTNLTGVKQLKRFVLIFIILINLYCVQNKILIKEIWLKSDAVSEEEKKSLVFKKIEKCNMAKPLISEEFKVKDIYDRSLTNVLEEAFRKSRNNPWRDVKIYKEDKSCVILEGYYNENK